MELERLLAGGKPPLYLTPMTRERHVALGWLKQLDAAVGMESCAQYGYTSRDRLLPWRLHWKYDGILKPRGRCSELVETAPKGGNCKRVRLTPLTYEPRLHLSRLQERSRSAVSPPRSVFWLSPPHCDVR